MGHIRQLDSNADPQAFPGALFEIVGDVPAAQCSEAKIEGEHGQTTVSFVLLTDPGAFAGFNLAGKTLHVISPPANAGNFVIVTNTDDFVLKLTPFNETSNDNVYYITDGGELILTRNVPSFAQYIHTAGYAYTIKGRKLYTNIPSGQLKNACTILFDPLT